MGHSFCKLMASSQVTHARPAVCEKRGDGLEAVVTRRPAASSLVLALPQGHWIHAEFSGPLVDGPGADVLVDARRFGPPARLFVTDGGAQSVPLEPTGTLTSAGGFAFSGFDLSGRELDFEPRAVRLEGCGAEGGGNCLELWVIKARTRIDE